MARRSRKRAVPASRRLWPDETPPTFGLPEHSSLTWEGRLERSWTATRTLLDPRHPRRRLAVKVLAFLALAVFVADIVIGLLR